MVSGLDGNPILGGIPARNDYNVLFMSISQFLCKIQDAQMYNFISNERYK